MKKGRKTLAFQIAYLGDNYTSMMWPGVADIARERDANLIIFSGSALNSPVGFNYQQNVIYEYINKDNVDALIMTTGTLRNFTSKEEFDIFCRKLYPLPVVSINVKLDDIPSIIIDNKAGMKEAVNHLIKIHGLKKIAFVRGPATNPEAAARYEAYQEVLEENGIKPDPRLVVQGNFLAASGFEAVKQLIDERKCDIEAVIAANDEMAMSIVEALKQREIRIPEDISVTGFDDIELSLFSSPPLTTVHQPLYQQARLAGGIALDMLEGRKVPMETILPASIVVRSSCGCFSGSIGLVKPEPSVTGFVPKPALKTWEKCKADIRDELKLLLEKSEMETGVFLDALNSLFELFDGMIINEEMTNKFLYRLAGYLNDADIPKENIRIWQDILTVFINHIITIESQFQDSRNLSPLFQKARILISEEMERRQAHRRIELYLNNVLFRDFQLALAASLDLEEISATLNNYLPILDIRQFYLSVYQKEVVHTRNQPWDKPDYSDLILAYDHKNGSRVTTKNMVNHSSRFLVPPEEIRTENRYTMVAYSLFSRDLQLGTIVFELGSKDRSIYESLNYQVGNALRSSLLFTERIKAEKELEKSNRKLKVLSEKDELTGLYNRRGFMKIAEQNLSLVKRMHKNGILMFADLDGLKKINDTYGHKEGDISIRAASKVLNSTFREADIIGRIGGDEFVVFAMDIIEDCFVKIKERFNRKIQEYNAASTKPYELSISVGAAFFDYKSGETIEELMTRADKILYENKRDRKSGAGS